MSVAVVVLVAALGAPAGDAQRAAQLEAWGELAEARRAVDAALAKAPTDPTALLVAACLDVEAGKLEDAASRAQALGAAGVPQGAVLRALVARRGAVPAEPLRDAIAPAWKAAGKPDLDGSLFAAGTQLWAEPPFEPQAWARLTPGERVLFGPWTASARRADALAASAHPDQNPVSVNHEVLDALTVGEGPPDASARAAAARVGAALTAVDPDDGYWEYVAWSSASAHDAPLTEVDLDRLERLASRPRFEIPRARFIEESRALAERFDAPHAACRAGRIGLRAGANLGALQLRAKATRWEGPEGAALRERTSKAMTAIGRRLASSRTYLERMVGWSLTVEGARLSGDPRRAEDARRRADEERGRYQRATAAVRAAGTWPFSSLCRDWSPDEVAGFERFLD